MNKLINMTSPKPIEWAKAAVYQHGWLPAYTTAKGAIKAPTEKGTLSIMPYSKYWQDVIGWIEKNAPAGALEEPIQEDFPQQKSHRKGKS